MTIDHLVLIIKLTTTKELFLWWKAPATNSNNWKTKWLQKHPSLPPPPPKKNNHFYQCWMCMCAYVQLNNYMNFESMVTSVWLTTVDTAVSDEKLLISLEKLHWCRWNTTSLTELHSVSSMETKSFLPFVRVKGLLTELICLCVGLSGSWRWTDTGSCTSCTKW